MDNKDSVIGINHDFPFTNILLGPEGSVENGERRIMFSTLPKGPRQCKWMTKSF